MTDKIKTAYFRLHIFAHYEVVEILYFRLTLSHFPLNCHIMDYKYLLLRKKLTETETEIAIHISQGKSYKWIANNSFTAESTVRKHAANIWKKAYVTNKNEFLENYPDVEVNFKLNPKLGELDNSLEKVISLSWQDENEFEAYFEDFSEMIRSMFQMDFSKRLNESNDKNSLLYFIAKSLNFVNEELEVKFEELKGNQKDSNQS